MKTKPLAGALGESQYTVLYECGSRFCDDGICKRSKQTGELLKEEPDQCQSTNSKWGLFEQ